MRSQSTRRYTCIYTYLSRWSRSPFGAVARPFYLPGCSLCCVWLVCFYLCVDVSGLCFISYVLQGLEHALNCPVQTRGLSVLCDALILSEPHPCECRSICAESCAGLVVVNAPHFLVSSVAANGEGVVATSPLPCSSAWTFMLHTPPTHKHQHIPLKH